MSLAIAKEIFLEFQKMTTPKRFNTFLIILVAFLMFAYYDLRKEKIAKEEMLNGQISAIYKSWILFVTEKSESNKETYERTLRIEFELNQLKKDIKDKKNEKTFE